MKDKKKIINDYKLKIKEFKKHNKLYFTKDSPLITDFEYDKLKKIILELEKKNPYLSKIDSIKSSVGAKPSNSFKKINHLIPMLSLSNVFNKSDMQDFLKKNK